MEEIAEKPPVQTPNFYKTLFFALLFIITVSVIGGGLFYLGKQQAVKPEIVPTPTITPVNTGVFPPYDAGSPPMQEEQAAVDKDVVPVGPNTVRFARVEENTYLMYRGKIYDGANQDEVKEFKMVNPDNFKWYGLVDAPEGVTPNEFMEDEVFGFKVAPDKKSFAFVMRWATPPPPKYPEYYLFYYTPFNKLRQSILVAKFTTAEKGKMGVAKIDQFSSDDKYLSLNMFGCWNCGGHQPETNLIRLLDNETKNIGRTSYFKWLEEGKYEYKDYVVIACVDPGPGECSEDPEKLPMKSGQF